MRRPFLVLLLTLGTIGGYAHGLRSLGYGHTWHHGAACGWHDPAPAPPAAPSTPAP